MSIFLNNHNRKAFKTHKCQFNYKILKDCLKIGTPAGVGHTLEMAAWSFILLMVTKKGSGYLTVQTIGSTVFILFAFFTDGLNKGVMAISSNLIGAGRWSFISQLLKSSVKLHLAVVSILFIPLILFPELIMDLFINKQPELLDTGAPLSATDLKMVNHYTVRALQWVWLYCVVDGIVWIISGILTSAGDTRFIMFVNISSVWIFAVIPTYLALYYYNAEPSTPWLLSVFYTIFNVIFLYIRYRSNKWKKLVLRQRPHVT